MGLSGTPRVRKAALAFIFVTVVLDMLALGITIPVLPKLILGFKGGDSAQAAAVYGIFGTLFAVMHLVELGPTDDVWLRWQDAADTAMGVESARDAGQIVLVMPVRLTD